MAFHLASVLSLVPASQVAYSLGSSRNELCVKLFQVRPSHPHPPLQASISQSSLHICVARSRLFPAASTHPTILLNSLPPSRTNPRPIPSHDLETPSFASVLNPGTISFMYNIFRALLFPSGDPRPFLERWMSSECQPGSHNEGERSFMYRFHGHSLRHIWEFCISNDNNQASICGQSYLRTTYLILHPHKVHGPPLSASATTLSSSSSNSGDSDWTGPPWSY